MTVDSALALNAEAVSLLAQDDYDSAMENLRTALDLTRSYTEEFPRSLQQQSGANDLLQVVPSCPNAYRRVLESGDIIFGQAFAAHIVNPTLLRLSDHDTSLLTVTLLFNLGLCYHLRGVSIYQSDPTDLQKALSIYRYAMGLSQNHATSPGPSVALVLVAIGNNMCSVTAALRKFNDLHTTLEWTHLQSTGIANNVPFFWLNVMFWKYLGTSPAPAA